MPTPRVPRVPPPAPTEEDDRPSPFGPLPAPDLGSEREILSGIHGRLGWILLVLVVLLLNTLWQSFLVQTR